MKLGEIYVWVTDQVRGREDRRKYHVYLCEAGWRAEGHAFLFINSSDYGGDYPISNADYPFLTQEISFVGCYIETYTEEKLAAIGPKLCGVLSDKHLIELRDAIASSDTMEQWQINLACEALRAAYK